MDSIDSTVIARAVRRRYEWGRAWRAVLGFAPTLLLVVLAASLSPRAVSVLVFGAVLFGNGALLLWYGHGLQRAVLPGVIAGLVPLTSALCANHFGHVCTGGACLSLCLPACVLGGVSAGALLGYWARRQGRGLGFVFAASSLTLLTGAMGCTCIGYAGVVGLIIGYLVGLVATVARPQRAR
jgi:hypothetical protein